VDCFEGKFEVNMLLANQKQNVKCACVAFLLALAKYSRDSGVVVSSDEKHIHRAHTKETARSVM
jgi:hypothetical protein